MCAYLSRLFQPGFQSADAILCRHGALYLNEKGASTVSWSTGPFVNVQPMDKTGRKKETIFGMHFVNLRFFFVLLQTTRPQAIAWSPKQQMEL